MLANTTARIEPITGRTPSKPKIPQIIDANGIAELFDELLFG
jgi:hypothetical protein